MGMPEYRDGTYGPIKPIDEALDELRDPIERERTRSLHIGSAEELMARAEAVPVSNESEPLARILQEEVERLRRDVNRLMEKGTSGGSEVSVVGG